ncbi:MAG: M48 family metalloprotease [Desulfobulbaceae bacterium]|jgi:Zn-dependent protease with chaperone function|nr:M48 family metalloprotease [Desulfobulbaceae bacterium]
MIYNNLLYFLVAIFVLSTDRAPEVPVLPPMAALPLLLAVYAAFFILSGTIYSRVRDGGTRAYFAAEGKLSILAVLLFVLTLHGLDLKYYVHPLSLDGRLPALENIGGLAFFFVFLILMWIRARVHYQAIFPRTHTALSFIVANIRVNLPIILPWMALSLLFDLLALLNIPGLQRVMSSPWGDLFLFLVFIVFLLLFFPPLVRALWGCQPLPPGPLRARMESFCRQQGFTADILVWPLFEGQVVTAGVMGIVPRLRYLLVTPALLHAMDWEELKAVLAHEIGHVKKRHLPLYIFLFLGFSLLAGMAVEPMPYLILGSDLYYRLLDRLAMSPEALLAVLVTVPLLLLMVVYFRYLFGYFIRNFERQADLYVFQALGKSGALISSFEKIAQLGGKIRDQKSWHHFGLGERIDFLEKCERDRGLVRRHDRKVYCSLVVYFLFISVSGGLLGAADYDRLDDESEIRYVEAVLEHKLRKDPENGLLFLLLGDLLQEKKMESRAAAAYERALDLNPMNPDVHNNLAWLLVTARDPTLHDPVRSLQLARRAVRIKESGYILDTLAVALWANDLIDEAMAAEARAMEIDPENKRYYLQQMKKIRSQPWAHN